MMAVRFLVIVAFAVGLPAQDPEGVIEGSVRDGVSMMPVPGVQILLHGAGRYHQTKADDAGTFRFEKLPAGEYALELKKPGYVGSDYADGKTEHVSLKPGAVTERVTIDLTPTAMIEGRVFDEEGRPLKGVHLYAQRKRRGLPIPATSEEEGRYRLEYLAPGDYEIEVRVPYGIRRDTVKRDAETGDMYGYANSQYYPGVDDARAAGIVPVGPAMHLGGFDIRLRRTRLVKLEGRAVDAVTREPLRGAEIELSPEAEGLTDETYERRRVDQQGGAFRFELIQPGRYSLLAYRGSAEDELPYVVPVDVGASGVVDLRVSVPPVERIEGRVTCPECKAKNWGALLVSLRPPVGGARPRWVKVGEDGTFVFDGIPPGRWRLWMNWSAERPGELTMDSSGVRPANWYVAAVRFGQQNALRTPLTVSEGSNPRIEVTLSDRAGRITGRVVDARQRPVKGAVVLVREADAEPGIPRQLYPATTSPAGAFTLQGLAPGEYVISAWPERFSVRELTVDRQRACGNRIAKVKVTDGSTSFAQLELCEQ